jgi:hypothetical protein
MVLASTVYNHIKKCDLGAGELDVLAQVEFSFAV